MKKNYSKHLTIKQQRQISLNHHSKKTQESEEEIDLNASYKARVIVRYGKLVDVITRCKQIKSCYIRRTINDLVVGDLVLCAPSKQDNDRDVVIQREDRNSLLQRPDIYKGMKSIAANIDSMFIVTAIEPEYNSTIIDRYLIIAETCNIKATIILNKIDLLEQQPDHQILKDIEYYKSLGVDAIKLSAKKSERLNQLKEELKSGIHIFVGLSGVGKSSLLNAVAPELEIQKTQIVNQKNLGQHTTTRSTLFQINLGGEIIDSPGIRELGLWHLDAKLITQGFKEINNVSKECKFKNCNHISDLGCEVINQVENNIIPNFRYESYLSLLEALTDPKLRYIKS